MVIYFCSCAWKIAGAGCECERTNNYYTVFELLWEKPLKHYLSKREEVGSDMRYNQIPRPRDASSPQTTSRNIAPVVGQYFLKS
jgi:hypothetical protein